MREAFAGHSGQVGQTGAGTSAAAGSAAGGSSVVGSSQHPGAQATTGAPVSTGAPFRWADENGIFSEKWFEKLPDELRGHASLKSIGTVQDLAKSYIHTKGM